MAPRLISSLLSLLVIGGSPFCSFGEEEALYVLPAQSLRLGYSGVAALSPSNALSLNPAGITGDYSQEVSLGLSKIFLDYQAPIKKRVFDSSGLHDDTEIIKVQTALPYMGYLGYTLSNHPWFFGMVLNPVAVAGYQIHHIEIFEDTSGLLSNLEITLKHATKKVYVYEIAPTFAYQRQNLSVGLALRQNSGTLTQKVETTSDSLNRDIVAEGSSSGYKLGFMLDKIWNGVNLITAYRSKVTLTYEGTNRTHAGTMKHSEEFVYPSQWRIGTKIPFPTRFITLDFSQTQTSEKNRTTTVMGTAKTKSLVKFRDVQSYATAYNHVFSESWQGSFGVNYETAARNSMNPKLGGIPTAPLIIWTTGGEYVWRRVIFELALAYTQAQSTTRISSELKHDLTTLQNAGKYKTELTVFSSGVRFIF